MTFNKNYSLTPATATSWQIQFMACVRVRINIQLCSSMFHTILPVFTWYLRVMQQSSTSCCRVTGRSGMSRSSIRLMSSGWWKSNTLQLRSLVWRTNSSRISMTLSKNSRLTGSPCCVLWGSRSATYPTIYQFVYVSSESFKDDFLKY